MFERIANGWELARESWEVLKQDKELLIFPVISGICGLIVTASFAVPLWGLGLLDQSNELFQHPEEIRNHPLLFVATFLFYWLNYFIILFFNSALVSCAVIRLRGGNPTVADGLSASMKALPQLGAWSFLAASIGMLLKLVESRSNKAGQFVTSLVGMAWTVATYFVVPVLVVERTGAFSSLKRSTGIVRRTWGEALAANFGIGFITFLAMVPGMIGIMLGFALIGSGSAVIGTTLIACGVVWMLVAGLVSSALDSILLAALYLYAVDGESPAQFNSTLLEQAFSHDRRSL